MSSNKSSKGFGVVMASDGKYVPYLRTAISSIRKYNKDFPIHLHSCGSLASLTEKEFPNFKIKQVKIPTKLERALTNPGELEHAWTRIAKLSAVSTEGYEKILYVDSDIIALTDLEEITAELPLENLKEDKPVAYMLLKRPETITINDISWLYFKDSASLTPQSMADLVNDTFSTDYSAEKLKSIDAWNAGIIYGSAKAIRLLSDLWEKFYLEMLTGKNKARFVPNDQLCVWLAVDQLKDQVEVKELPLKWNFMPGHGMREITQKPNPNPQEIKSALDGVKILHLAQNKTDVWAQVLINELNSERQV